MSERFLVTGATGQLGTYLVRELLNRGHEIIAWSGSRSELVHGVRAEPVDLTDHARVDDAFREARATHVIHAAAVAAVGDCARDPVRADAVNHRGTAKLAELAGNAGARLVFVSTDLVFDGEHSPYRETDPPKPLSVYGRSKAGGESAVAEFAQNAVVRISLLFGPSLNGRASFFDGLVASLRNGQRVRLFHDEWRTPISLANAAEALIEIALSDVTGVLHVGGPERMSRLEMGQRLASHLRVDHCAIDSVSRTSAPGEPRPRDTTLDSSRFREQFRPIRLLTLEEALSEMKVI